MATKHTMTLTLHRNGLATVRTAAATSLPEYYEIADSADIRNPYPRDVRPGDEGCLVTRVAQGFGNPGATAWLQTVPVGGNMDSSVKRYHGWRGTTNEYSVWAYGWRRVLSVRVYGNGAAVVRLSSDLRPDEA